MNFHLPENRADFRLIEGLEEELNFETVPSGSELFRQGDHEKWFILIRKGLVKVTRVSGDGDQIITELLLPGDLCGALCALDSCPYPVGARALTSVELAKVDVADFHQLSVRFPNIHRCSLEGCANKIREQRAMMSSIALERIPQRLWKVFLVLAQRLGTEHSEGISIPFPFSRQELAEMIGATNESVTRALGKMKKDGEIAEAKQSLLLLGIDDISEIEKRAHI